MLQITAIYVFSKSSPKQVADWEPPRRQLPLAPTWIQAEPRPVVLTWQGRGRVNDPTVTCVEVEPTRVALLIGTEKD
ncbi:unnamed protein product [Pleuronectes platessa]|uniref:Uncharacterized protein n=1 Tax=Pleuronectes platessa TaxID=8262 RepID=A0A9N7Z849_PLEPL|nr:unnamed protein product [Pleuronectes platessa]